jgi:hypothetical protein
MLTRFDDYPIHQTPEPIAHPASSDRNAYDRYWFNGFDKEGQIYFAVALGLYPHRGVMDCSLSVVESGEQHSFHASRRMPAEPSETTVGPFRIEVLEPMRSILVRLEPNETGIECDLIFTARTACVDEGRQTLRSGTRVVFDATRFAQFGRWQGEIGFAGRTATVDATRVYGTKDRSWGIRPIGEPESGGAPAMRIPQFFFLWAPIQWEDYCTHFGVYEDSQGLPWHSGGAIVPAYPTSEGIPGSEDPGTRKMASVSYRITHKSGTRRASAAELTLAESSGQRHVIALEPIMIFQMKGLGYTHPEWGHARWKGELAVAGESWKIADLDPLAIDNVHTQQLVRARMDDQEGIGILEEICLGPHAPSGFMEFLDGAS